MKRVSKLLLLVLGFSAGLLAGAFIRLGFEIINGRPVSIGGEAFALASSWGCPADFMACCSRFQRRICRSIYLWRWLASYSVSFSPL